jgi:hypothetical protein
LAPSTKILDAGMTELTRSRAGPVARDLDGRALRVTRRMKQLATGIDGGPQIRLGVLQSSIGFLRFGDDGTQLTAEIGIREGRTLKRGWNYALILEGPNSCADPRVECFNNVDFGTGARRPFMAPALLAAAD